MCDTGSAMRKIFIMPKVAPISAHPELVEGFPGCGLCWEFSQPAARLDPSTSSGCADQVAVYPVEVYPDDSPAKPWRSMGPVEGTSSGCADQVAVYPVEVYPDDSPAKPWRSMGPVEGTSSGCAAILCSSSLLRGCLILLTIASAQLHADAAFKPVSPGERIRDLRALQRCASLSLYDDIEHQIAELRDPKSICPRYTPAIARACRVGHLLPFIVWQLLFLCGLLLIFVRRSRIVGLLIILIVGVILLFAAYERSDRWRYISVDTTLYLGPGSGYPVRKGLVPGDEVRVIRRAPEKTDGWMFVDACGEKGWLPHDVVV